MGAERQKTILLVEDEAIIAMTEKKILEKYGYQVLVAGTGEEAIAVFEKTPGIDLILIDINLGAGMDGTEAAAIILQNHDLPVVFLSSHMEPEVVEKTEKITSYGYVVKNSSGTVLDASIKMAFKLFAAKVSETKKEEDLRQSEETMRYIVKHDPNAIAVYDRNLHYIAVSDRYLRDYNVREEDIIGKHHYRVFPEMPQKWKDVHQRCLAGAIEGNEDDSFERPDGSVTYNRWECRPWRRVDGEIGGIVTYTEVTTDRKNAEKALRTSEKRLRDIIFSMADWVWEVDEKGVYTYSSEKGEALLGYSQTEIIGKTPFDFMPADEAKRVGAIFSEIVANKRPIKDLENWNIGKNGESICLLTNGVPILDEKGNLKGYRGVDKDISERKRTEKLPETLYKISQAVYAADNLNELFRHVHRALADIIPTDNLFIALLSDDGKTMNFPYFIDEKNPDDTSSIKADDMQSLTVEVLATKRSLLLDEAELLERYASGRNKVWGSAPKCWLGVPLMILDTIIGVMAVQDYHKAGAYIDKDVKLLESTAGQIAIAIDRKRAAEALRESVDSFRGYFNMGTVGMCVTSLETGWIEVNDCLCRMLGYSRDELIRLTWAEMTHPEDLNSDLDLFNQVLAGERDSYELEKRFIRKDGQVIYTRLYATCQRNLDGTVHHLLASLVDISERKRAEEGIQNTLRFQQALMDAVPSPIFYKDANCIYIGGNKAFEQFIGLAQEQFIGKTVYDISPADLAEKYERADRELLKNKGIQTYEASVVYADGTRHAVIFNKALFTDSAGKVAGLIGVILDISERKQAEILEQAVFEIARAADKAASLDDLYRSVHRIIQTLMPATNILIARYDEKENLVSFPYFVDEKDPMPKPRKSSRGLTDYVLRTGRTLLSDAALEKELERSGEAKRRGSPSACWLGVPLKFGDKAIGVIALDNYSDPKAYGEREKKILEYVSSQIANAIERKQAEEEIKRQLTEKEVLLKEVHHRIKNNIAAIGGLISLRLQSIANPEAAAVLKDAVGRIDSMRILYDKLLLSEDYADISVKNYLETLIDTIAAIFPDEVMIRIEKRIADFHLGSKKLFPLGIIINELLTNKMKYAFSGRKRGAIRINLALADNRAKLTIEDDGNPLPPGFDIKEAKGFGLMLVKMLSQQLGGSFAIENHKGVRCTVEFDI